jgi:DAHL domain
VLAPLDELVTREDDLSEHFKTDNALLRNSLAYFGRFNSRVGRFGPNDAIGPAVTTLMTSMLHLALDTSAPSVTAVDDGLRGLAELSVDADEAGLVAELLSHGRVLRRVLPETDQVLRSLYDTPGVAYARAARASILAHQQTAETTAAIYRFLLYAASVALAGLMVTLGGATPPLRGDAAAAGRL